MSGTRYYLRNREHQFISGFGPQFTANLIQDAQEYESREEAQEQADLINAEIENEDDHFDVLAVDPVNCAD